MDLITDHGLRMPKLGLGTMEIKGEAGAHAIATALRLGYRHLDTAQRYANEDEVGQAVAASGVPRSDIHITTKVWWDHFAPDAMRRAMEQSLKLLRTDYVDLYLLHWPAPGTNIPLALETIVKLKEEGHARKIGVANFPVALMRLAVEEIGAPVACNQVEYHVMLDQSAVLGYARAHDIAITAYCPVGRGTFGENAVLKEIARKHNATPQQVALKWLLDQDGVAAIPKASHEENQRTNLEATRLRLDDADRAAIAKLPKDKRLVRPAFAPVWDNAA